MRPEICISPPRPALSQTLRLKNILSRSPALQTTHDLTREFATILRHGHQLPTCMDQAEQALVLADGVRRGQREGQLESGGGLPELADRVDDGRGRQQGDGEPPRSVPGERDQRGGDQEGEARATERTPTGGRGGDGTAG